MSIFQFVWQVIVLCAIAAMLVFGLFSAPWYVLGGVLLIALLLTWKLMPSQETWVAATHEAADSLHGSHPPTPAAKSDLSQSTNLLYRGAQYPTPEPKDGKPPAPSAVLSYRGASYAPPPKAVASKPSGSPERPIAPELKYRGAKIASPSKPSK